MVSGWVDQAFTFVRSFSRQERINLIVADCWPNSGCGHSRYCNRFHLIPSFREPGYIPTLLEVCKQERIDVVLPVHQEDLVEVAKQKDLFVNAGFRLPIPAQALIDLANDKYRMAQLAEENGISVPRTHLLSDVRSGDPGTNIPFPLLVKLRNSTGQRGQKKVCSMEALESHILSLLEKHGEDEIIVQEVIPGTDLETMYTVGLLYDHNHQLKACVPLKKIRSRPYTGGTAICTRAENRPDVKQLAIDLMGCLAPWEGIADVEIKIGPNGRPVFIELNPRPWGSMYGTFVAGVDFPMLWLKVALKEDFDPVVEFREGIYGSFLSRDLVLLRDLLRELFGQDREEVWQVLKTYSQPYFHRRHNTTKTSDFVLDDLVPFFKNLARF